MLKHTYLAVAAVVLGLVALLVAPGAEAQAGLSTGTIQGTILDPHGASVPGAKVTITSKGTGAKQTPEVTSVGSYSSGPLVPGAYLVRVEAAGFRAVEQTVTVQVGNITPANITLEVGSETTIVTVEAAAINVNTDQATIQGVVTTTQIENLPINGRNFLDLAQLEPGVQIQDGGNFDPTKKGFSSISFGGRFGRTARIEVDGLDISDETVGTTTQNISVGSIKEFQVSQSSLDLATELTSSGTVNITTRSGTNAFHGDGLFQYRGDATSAAFGDPPAKFDRKQYGVSLGGPLIKDKLFAFGSGSARRRICWRQSRLPRLLIRHSPVRSTARFATSSGSGVWTTTNDLGYPSTLVTLPPRLGRRQGGSGAAGLAPAPGRTGAPTPRSGWR